MKSKTLKFILACMLCLGIITAIVLLVQYLNNRQFM